jgi:hypothetical protein
MTADVTAAASVVWFLSLALLTGGVALSEYVVRVRPNEVAPPLRFVVLSGLLAFVALTLPLATKVIELTGNLDTSGIQRVALETRLAGSGAWKRRGRYSQSHFWLQVIPSGLSVPRPACSTSWTESWRSADTAS